jgi:hypothetical protein
MKESYKYLVILLVGMALVLNSCKEDCPCTDDPTNPDCDNYDPCFGKTTVDTYFKVRSGDNGFPPPEEWCDLVACDTFNASSVRFDIPDGNPLNSSYEWQIGTEAETRKGNSFEVDFSDYLRLNGWETRIPISLTVRTPMNECLQSEDETVKTITRELFFTNERWNIYKQGKEMALFEGYYTSEPGKKAFLKIEYVRDGNFRGIDAPYGLTTGFPSIDTLMGNKDCPIDGCNNFIHRKIISLYPENCSNKKLAHYIKSTDIVFEGSNDHIYIKYFFTPPTGDFTVEFKGKRKE